MAEEPQTALEHFDLLAHTCEFVLDFHNILEFARPVEMGQQPFLGTFQVAQPGVSIDEPNLGSFGCSKMSVLMWR